MNHVARAVGVIFLAVAAAACGDGGGNGTGGAGTGGWTGPPLGSYFTPTASYTNAACKVVDGRLEGTREMRLYFGGPGVDVSGLTQGLARYYQRHSLTFSTQSAPQPAGTTYAVDTDQAALGDALAVAFPDVDFTNDASAMADPAKWNAIMTFIANFMLRPMIDFARAHGDVGQGATNLAVVPDLERPGGMKLGNPGTTIVGLAISPPLLAEFVSSMAEEGAFWQDVSLPPGFTPMMFLSDNAIRSKTTSAPILRDLIAAHEFGHASGLVHSDTPHNLMYPSLAPNVNGCTDSLTDTQLAIMRTNLRVGPAAAAGALSSAAPAARRRFTPADLRALLGGDRRALRRFLGPLVHDEPPGAPTP